ncbi:MAG: YesL family protein [Lachnospiraceae bacterium]|nr:YesL family protein [Lachnospiraceae bacterium]MDE7436559.1 YesL family protein [Lachnospiraceae bacterium]
MSGIFSYNNKFFQFVSKLVDIFCVSMLWVVGCIPVFTIGASSTALYYTVNKVIHHERGYLWKEFWGAFRSNFKQATLLWMGFLGFAILMWVDQFIMSLFMEDGSPLGYVGYFFLIMFWLTWLVWLFVYPNIARFENTSKAILKNAVLMMVAHFPYTLLLVVCLLILLLITWGIPALAVIMPALFSSVQNSIMERIFRKYMSPEDLAREDEKNREYQN